VSNVEPGELEAWGRVVVAHAAELIFAEIPAVQLPEVSPPSKARTAGSGYVSRSVHFRHPGYPVQRSVWLFVVSAEHRYNIGSQRPRAVAGLMQDPDTELSPLRSVAGLLRSGAFTWRRHNDDRYQGYRLVVDVDPDVDAPEARAEELAAAVLHGLRRASLIPLPSTASSDP
jgi:hypothetical protein